MAIMADLITDIEDIIDYLVFIRYGIVYDRIIPVDKIISELKEATINMDRGYFPFKIQAGNWTVIREYMTISAYYDNPAVYTIVTSLGRFYI